MKRSVQINVRLSHEESELLATLAAELGQSPQQALRHLLWETKKKKESDVPHKR